MIAMKSMTHKIMKLAVRMKLPMVMNRTGYKDNDKVDMKPAMEFLQVELLCLSYFPRKAPNQKSGAILAYTMKTGSYIIEIDKPVCMVCLSNTVFTHMEISRL